MLKKICSHCKKTLHWKHIRFKAHTWPCWHCNTVHPLLDTVLTPDNMAYKDKINKAKGVRIRQSDPLLLIITARVKGNGWRLLLAGLLSIWFGTLVLKNPTAGLGLSIFLTLLFLIGLGLLYLAAKRLLISHEIQIKTDTLQRRCLLLGWLPLNTAYWASHTISQFFVIGDGELESDTGTHVVYHLMFQQKGKEDPTRLITGIKSYQTAFYLERLLEHSLNLEDTFVKGEFVPYADLLHLGLISKGIRAFRWMRRLRLLEDD